MPLSIDIYGYLMFAALAVVGVINVVSRLLAKHVKGLK